MDSEMKAALAELESLLTRYKQEKSGEFMIDVLCDFYLRQPETIRESIDRALVEWLHSGNAIRADYAIAMCARLKIIRNLPSLKAELKAVKTGESKLPKYFTEFLSPAIDDLEKTVAGNMRPKKS